MQEVPSNCASRWTTRNTACLLLFLSIGLGAFSRSLAMSGAPAGAVSSAKVSAPAGVKVLAQLPLPGPAPTRMFTQWEDGSVYLYVEHAGKQVTAVDITIKGDLRVVQHRPEKVIAPSYAQAEGGPIEISPKPRVRAGVDNVRDGGTLSVLQTNDPRDAQLLRFFGYDASNLVDRDRRLVFFASPTRLLILEDDRWYGVDYDTN